jgi:hypothetical protein
MRIKIIKFKDKQLNSSEWVEKGLVRLEHKIIYRKKYINKWHNLCNVKNKI